MPVAGLSERFSLTVGADAFLTASAAASGPQVDSIKEAIVLFVRSLERDLSDRFAQIDAQVIGLRDFIVNVHGGLLQRDAELRHVASQLDDASATVLRADIKAGVAAFRLPHGAPQHVHHSGGRSGLRRGTGRV